MDHRGTKLLGIVATGLLVATAAIAAEGQPLRAMAWLAPEGQFEALGKTPTIAPTGKKKLDRQFMVGRLLFQTPTILGGQAAKAGLSCESCHQSGASNPHFLFPGVSGSPGTADVTHSFFSAHRGNGEFDPVPIPDLTKPGKVSHERKALEVFIRDLIVEEFSGAEPRAATIDALAFYVRDLQGAESLVPENRRLSHQLDNVSAAVSLAKSSIRTGDAETAKLLIASARHQLRLIHERYTGPRLKKHRDNLIQAGMSLGEINKLMDKNPEQVSSALLRWDKLFLANEKMLKDDEEKSLYNPERLQDAITK